MFDWAKSMLGSWFEGWKNSLAKSIENGMYHSNPNSGNLIIDILLTTAIIGAILNMAGSTKWGNKLLFGSIIIGAIWMVICSV